jgi:HD-like signal output (HDOD) protein
MVAKIEKINNLPTLPSIALAVNKRLKDYDAPMEDLVALLEKDQSMVMKILRLVNSSFFGLKSTVKSVGHAVTLLGYNTVQNAVVTVSVIESLTLKNKIQDFEIDDFWKHSISVAVMSKFIAAHTRLASPEDAFTSGLLHDIGKIIWANF